MPEIGMRELYDEAALLAIKPEAEQLGWGISDHELVHLALDELEQWQSPFLAEILMLSNHYPFDKFANKSLVTIETGHRIYNHFLRGTYYTDQALGLF